MSDIIKIGIYDELKITQEGICALLKDAPDLEMVVKAETTEQLLHQLKQIQVNVLIIVVHSYNLQFSNLVIQISSVFTRVQILVVSVSNDEEAVLRTIKAGA